jgi:hypothetical protein
LLAIPLNIMPTYLLHGFRWLRANIRIHIILNDLEDAAAEWIVAPATSITLLNSFYSLYDFLPPSIPPQPTYPPPPPIPPDELFPPPDELAPPKSLSKKNSRSMVSLRSLARRQKPVNLERPMTGRPPTRASNTLEVRKASAPSTEGSVTPNRPQHSRSNSVKKGPSFNDWSVVKLVEQYDPMDMYSTSQPYAYVADYMVEVTLGASLSDEINKYEAKVRKEEGPLDPSGSAGYPDMLGTAGDLASPGFSARDLRRKSRRLGWFEKLRDELQKGVDIGWYVVVCGDEERVTPSVEALRGRYSGRPSTASETSSQRMPRSTGFKGIFRKRSTVEE